MTQNNEFESVQRELCGFGSCGNVFRVCLTAPPSEQLKSGLPSLKYCDPNLCPRLLLSPVCANQPHIDGAWGRKKEVIKKKTGKRLSGIKRKPSVSTRWDYTWLVMTSKCAKNLRQGNIKRDWCWKRTKGVGRWRRLLLLMSLFDVALSFRHLVILAVNKLLALL